MENQEEDLVSLKEAAVMLKLEEDTLRKYVQKKKVIGQKVGGRWYFYKSDLKERIKPSSKDTNSVSPLNDQILNIDEPNQQSTDKNHVEDLSECAKKLVKILETYIGWPINYRVENILNDLKDFENLKFFENKMARGVLVHLAQSEDFPQLKQLDSWINLKASDINEVFLAMISLKAASGEFKGECDICRPKPDSNRKVA